MDYLTSGNACLKEGASLIAWGAFLTSLGWVLLGLLLGKYGDINRWLSKVKPFRKTVIRGIIAIMLLTGIFACIRLGLKKVGEGGTLTTKGWNLLNVHSQRQNLIRAVVQELCVNVLSLEGPPMKGETYYRKENGGVITHPFPTLKTTALNAVMSSGLWNLGNQTERTFLYTIFDYERAIDTANSLFGAYNDSVNSIIDPNKKITEAEKCQKIAPEKASFKSLESRQNDVIKLLLDEYKWAIPPTEEGKLLLQRIQEKPSVNKPEDVNKPKETLPKNQVQEVNLKSEAPSF